MILTKSCQGTSMNTSVFLRRTRAAVSLLRILGFASRAMLLALTFAATSFAQTSTCPFNLRAVDATTGARASTDGQLALRAARGMRDAALINGLSRASPAPNATNVIEHIHGNAGALDIDGDGEFTQVDSILIARRLLGLNGAALTTGLTIPTTATRRTATAISKFIDDGCVADLPVMPVEVIGPAGYIEAITVTVGDPTNINRLWLQCHRCGWRDSTVQSGINRGAKASVRLNGGAWVDISNTTAAVEEPEASSGGIGGGYNTTRFTVPVAGARKGKNTLEFRFNANDGLSVGYRILDLNFLRSDNRSALGKYAMTLDDPTKWVAQPSATTNPNLSADIAAGSALWLGSVALKESPLSNRVLKASCSSCHAVDGRDLKYFNYSDWSIQERAKFHGLTTTQGKQLAAYIRSLNVPAPKQARPWNPPYQPGPGLDAKPVAEWAAGAGLSAVLRTDAEMLPFLFPNGTSDSAIRGVIDKTKTLNVREMPVAIQFPDWNDWLPHEHPIDAFETQFLTHPVSNSTLPQLFADLDTYLTNTPISQAISSGQLYNKLNTFASASTNFSNPVATAALQAGVDSERITTSIATWGAVKQWELMQRYNLEDKAALVHGSFGEPRSWLTMRRNVFEIAPHRSAENNSNFPFQIVAVGKYLSTSWYQLQLTINAGNRKGVNLWPVDWNYQPNHIVGLHTQGDGPIHPLRYIASHTKMFQQYADGDPMATTSLGFRQIHIQRYVPGQGHGVILDSLPAAMRVNAYEALLNATMDVLSAYRPEDWVRGTPNGTSTVEPVDYVLTNKAITRGALSGVCHGGEFANCWYSAIPYYKEIGVDTAVITRLIDWGKAMWPAPGNNWDALR
jgi:hypothetical protein